jgi:gluconate 5-dehydrogenase
LKALKAGKIINYIVHVWRWLVPNFSLYEGENCQKYTNPPHYGAAKAALIQLTKYYAVLLGHTIFRLIVFLRDLFLSGDSTKPGIH